MRIGGVEVFTERDSLSLALVGGLAADVQVTTTGERVGQRGRAGVTGITGNIYPITDAESNIVRNLLRQPGVMPLILPDNRRFPVMTTPEGHTLSGYYDNRTASYGANWIVQPNILMADLPWAGNFPGQYAFSSLATKPFDYANVTLTPYVGWNVTGTSWASDGRIKEDSAAGVNRRQVTLFADVTINPGAVAVVGLADITSNPTANLFGSKGIGAFFSDTDNFIRILDENDQVVESIEGSADGRYRVMVTARPFFARVEIWNRTLRRRLLFSNQVPWTLINNPIGALLRVKTGTVILRQWWLSR